MRQSRMRWLSIEERSKRSVEIISCKLLVLLSGGGSANSQNAFHITRKQAFAQGSLPYHARCSKENYFHVMAAFPFPVFSRRLNTLGNHMADEHNSGLSIWPDLIERIRARTPARVLAGRTGAAYRTATQLELRTTTLRHAMPFALSLAWKEIWARSLSSNGNSSRSRLWLFPRTNIYAALTWDAVWMRSREASWQNDGPPEGRLANCDWRWPFP